MSYLRYIPKTKMDKVKNILNVSKPYISNLVELSKTGEKVQLENNCHPVIEYSERGVIKVDKNDLFVEHLKNGMVHMEFGNNNETFATLDFSKVGSTIYNEHVKNDSTVQKIKLPKPFGNENFRFGDLQLIRAEISDRSLPIFGCSTFYLYHDGTFNSILFEMPLGVYDDMTVSRKYIINNDSKGIFPCKKINGKYIFDHDYTPKLDMKTNFVVWRTLLENRCIEHLNKVKNQTLVSDFISK